MGSTRNIPGDNRSDSGLPDNGKEALRVLIVEDNDSDYLLLLRRVQKLLAPCRCERSATRSELVAALVHKRDLIITDFHLLDIEGQALLATIAAAQPDTPCLVLSGSLPDLREAGAFDNVFRILAKGDNVGLQEALMGDWEKPQASP